jgi:hypothetical protein
VARTDSAQAKEVTILRGISTVNLWAEDLPAATNWYAELLGVEPTVGVTPCRRSLPATRPW